MVIFTGAGRCGISTAGKVFRVPPQRKGTLPGLIRSAQAKDGSPYPTRDGRVVAVREHFAALGINERNIGMAADRSCVYYHVLDAIPEIDPDVRIVYLTRDPYAHIPSSVARGGHLGTCWTTHPTLEDPEWFAWEGWSPVEKAAWVWNFRNVMAFGHLRNTPQKNWLCVRIEDFWDRVQEVSEFTGWDPDLEIVKSRTLYGTTDKSKLRAADTWTNEEHDRVIEIAHQGMELCGYGPFSL